jgi:protein-S-isoprenylcysteine O-methyltransferase Ste14
MKYYHFVSPFLMWTIIVAGMLFSISYFSDSYLFDPSGIFYVLAGGLILYWMYFFTKGITSNTQAPLRPHHITRLITHGAYAQLRHPIYSAYIALALGLFCVYPTVGMCIAVFWLAAVMLSWIYLEERSLLEIFGDQYRDYMRKVSMILPLRKKRHF